jgi:hypothetical protein
MLTNIFTSVSKYSFKKVITANVLFSSDYLQGVKFGLLIVINS